MIGRWKGKKRDRQTAKQSCQPLGKLKIKKREEEKDKKNLINKYIYFFFNKKIIKYINKNKTSI